MFRVVAKSNLLGVHCLCLVFLGFSLYTNFDINLNFF